MKLPNLSDLSRTKVEQKLAHETRKAVTSVRSLLNRSGADGFDIQPCSYRQWLDRTNGRYEVDFPPEWKKLDLPFDGSDSRVAVVIHVYYSDLVTELAESLKNIPVPCDVYVTNASDQEISSDVFAVGNVQNSVVIPIKNHGRDIAPLVYLANAGYLDPYDLILKVHTKKSPWREAHQELSGSGDDWRDNILGSLVGSPSQVQRILDEFALNPRLGAVGAPDSIVGSEFWGGDEELVGELGKRLGLRFNHEDLEFISGSMYWIRGFLLQGLRSLCMHYFDFHEEEGQIDGTTAHAVERLIGLLTKEAGLLSIETSDFEGEADNKRSIPDAWHRFLPTAKLIPAAQYIPFYLPQFHPSDVNDRWWGKGFTEWSNVTQARPVFEGQVQPLIAGELGFYDLRLDSVRERQLELEQYSGVAGLMYYYYWFSGERVLNLPIERLQQQQIDQPFCLMWANENWTRAWDGNETDVLLSQSYDEVPAELFINDILEFLLDPRYMRVNGAAILAVYRPRQMGNFAEVARIWREKAREAGAGELLLLSVDVTKNFDGIEPDELSKYGLDGHLGFPPHGVEWPRATREEARPIHPFVGHLMSYRRFSHLAVAQALHIDSSGYPGVMVNFDNTSRKKWRADVWYGSNPYTFHKWLLDVTESLMNRTPDQRIVFINAWNEWAESAVLEPTARWGMTYLQAVRNVAFS